MLNIHTKVFAQNIKPNTLIGGVGATISSKQILAERLQIASNRIKGFKLIGLNIECKIVGGYGLGRSDSAAIFPNTLTYFIDNAQLAFNIGNGSFVNMINLETFEAYGVKNFTTGGGDKMTNTKVEELCFPNITNGFISGLGTAGFSNRAFFNNNSLKRLIIPNEQIGLSYLGDQWFMNAPNMELIDMRKTKQVGRSLPTRGWVFNNVGSALIPGVGKFHENIVSVAIDGGAPDVNMMRLYNKGWQIQLYNDAGVYVGDFTI